MEEIENIFWSYLAHEKGATIIVEKQDIEAIRNIINYYIKEKK